MTPLLRVTLAFMAGLVPGLLLSDRWLPLLLLFAAGAAGALPARRWRSALMPALFAALGALAAAAAAREVAASCAARWPHGARVSVRGYVSALPQPGRAVSFTMLSPCAQPLRVTLPRHAHVPVGAAVALDGQWRAFERASRWPVPAERRGILFARSVRPLPEAAGAGPLLRARIAAQRVFRSALPRRHGVAEALVLAQRDALDPAVRDAFAASGLAHLLAISGSHVVVFAGMLLLALRILRVPLAAARALAVILIGGYVLALGAPPPAARAALQFALVIAAVLLQRPAHAWSLAAGAALLLLAAEPLHALDAGFQLSFAGVCGLLAWRRPLVAALPAALPSWLRDGIGTGLAATAATAPIAALHFGQFAPVGLAATLLAAPLVALALGALALLLLVHVALPAAALALGPGIELVLGTLLAVARAAAAVPGGHVPVDAHTLRGVLVLCLAALPWLAHRRAARPRSRPRTPAERGRSRRLAMLEGAAALALGAALLAWLPRFTPAAGYLEVHAIDVGQGDAIALRTPRGRWLLVDAGMRAPGSDMGSRRVVPYLLRLGVRRIDALILTHAHADHIGGARAVLAAFEVGTVFDPGAPGASEQYLETLRAAAAEPARWVAPRPGSELVLDDVRLRFLFPPGGLLDAPADPNDFSLVFRVGFGRFGALFLGDAPQSVEEALVAEHGRRLASAVLKVGHHGSRTATGDALLAAVLPRIALVSVGRDNRYGHPWPGVLARLLRHQALVLRTDEHGSIRIRAWRSGRIELATQR